MKGAKIILHAKSPTFRAAKLKGFTVISVMTSAHMTSSSADLKMPIDAYFLGVTDQ